MFMTRLHLAGLLLVALAALALPRAASAQRVPLRQVDWYAVLASEPGIQIDANVTPLPGFPEAFGPWINVRVADPLLVPGISWDAPTAEFGGFAMISADEVLYGDIDGDGRDEAVIRTESTGTGGSFGFLLYREASPRPRLVAAVPGYKLSVAIDAGVLDVRMPYYFGFEGNCCPTGGVRRAYRLTGDDALTQVDENWFIAGETAREAQFAEVVVTGFYRALNVHRFDDAFQFLSATQQGQQPYDAWQAGFAATQSVGVQTAPGSDPNEVLVDIVTVDDAPGGGTVSHRYIGSWLLVPSASVPWGLALDRAVIAEVTAR